MLSHSTSQPRVHNVSSASFCAIVCSVVGLIQQKNRTLDKTEKQQDNQSWIFHYHCVQCSVNPMGHPSATCGSPCVLCRFTSFTSLQSELTRPFNVLNSDNIVSCPCCTSSCFVCKASTRRFYSDTFFLTVVKKWAPCSGVSCPSSGLSGCCDSIRAPFCVDQSKTNASARWFPLTSS